MRSVYLTRVAFGSEVIAATLGLLPKKLKTMKNLKYQISRSFSRKVNLGGYENADFFSSHSQEIPVEINGEERKKISETLFISAKLEVEAAIIEFRNKLIEKKPEQEAQTDLYFGLEKQEEEDERSNKLKEANENLGLK